MKKFAAAVSLAVVAGAASASGITYQTGAGFEAGLADSAAYQSAVSGLVGAPVALASFDNASFALSNSAFEATIKFDVTSPETFDFRAGVDLGGGGTLVLDGTALDTKSNNMWWNYSYSDASQFLAGSANLSVGVHTLTIYGFEDCCSGNMQVQFSTDGTKYTSFGATDGLPAIPEAQSFAMLLAGLGLVATLARRRSNTQA
ncbi:CCXG family PEP-CTERM protein [Scleromatobacter humisilvae]|uniref:CCXG family PEP-CTERM protein n=1 Tax=Scleromatobacter humisilvae TaxID=2897159 RepID=A0A9X1YNY3_9BURK|nr:CCXG family PEP-CTERM protein [Scleromatobacter humisilvae]MCK9688450.1 CCXG family PEP-CTERM protein [Scleromatobacter humisilvae]